MWFDPVDLDDHRDVARFTRQVDAFREHMKVLTGRVEEAMEGQDLGSTGAHFLILEALDELLDLTDDLREVRDDYAFRCHADVTEWQLQ